MDPFVAELEADIAQNRLILPSLPDVAAEVCALIDQPDSSLTQLAEVIGRDPALCVRLLKVANGVGMRGNAVPIEDIRTAVTRLGLRLVRSLISSLAIIQSFNDGDAALNQELRAVSTRSVAIGALCATLTGDTRLHAEQAMVAGLIHDIGRLPLLRRIYERADLRQRAELLTDTVEQIHPRIGRLVLENWKFPPELVAVASEHENIMRDSGTRPDYVDVVIAANLIHYHPLPDNPYAALDLHQVPALQKLGLDPEALHLADESVQQQHQELSQILVS